MNSVNHHYIPQLYLKGFTSSNGKLQVFDKVRNEFKKDKQTPKTVLFEKNRNTIELNGERTDHLERMYGKIETPLAQYFNFVRKGISQNDFTSKESLSCLKLFIAIQYWRMPLVDTFADSYIQKVDLFKFGSRFNVAGRFIVRGCDMGDTAQLNKRIKVDKVFRYYFRCFFLPELTFDLDVHENEWKFWRIHTVSPENKWDNFLTGDNPLIVENEGDIFKFKSKLIIPFSKNQLITYSPTESNNKDFPPIFSTLLAFAMSSQSDKYLVGANREYMQNIIRLQKEMYDSNDDLIRHDLFKHI